jgi:hypothetical protein
MSRSEGKTGAECEQRIVLVARVTFSTVFPVDGILQGSLRRHMKVVKQGHTLCRYSLAYCVGLFRAM